MLKYRPGEQSRFEGYVTKLLILTVDMLFSFVAISLALFIEVRYNISDWRDYMLNWAPWVLLVFRAISFVVFKTYLIIIRYVGEQDMRNLFYAITSSSVAFTAFMYFQQELLPPGHLSAILILDYFIVLFLGGGFRAFLRIFYIQMRARQSSGSRLNTVIYGAGEMGVVLEQVLRKSIAYKYKVVAFFDDNPRVHKKILNGIPIYNPEKIFDPVIENNDVHIGIIAIKNLPDSRRIRFINRCLEHRVKVMKVPPTTDWLNNRLHVGQLKNIDFEDLLDRPAIDLDKEQIAASVKGKVVLVTGCAGSIGSEIIRQLMNYEPAKVIGLDQAETPVAELTLSLTKEESELFEGVIGDIRDYMRIEYLFTLHQPQIVFHAAAYKHVPIMEEFPSEAIKANVKGTMILAEVAQEFDVEKFVMVSTDKVVNPTNIMGATKRIAEIYVQSMSQTSDKKTQFITTRFGNVLGSNGSVITIFKRQIENGNPVTVTHPEVTRYFMTIPEACQLVLEAGAMGEGGEIFVFDMGKPVKIDELARKMIRMAGYEVDKDIEIKYTGLRPGEKLHEELLDKNENLMATHHSKILKASIREMDRERVIAITKLLIERAEMGATPLHLASLIKELVPEYDRPESEFESIELDLEDLDQYNEVSQDSIPQVAYGPVTYQDRIKKFFLHTLGKFIPSDVFSHRYPVSVKGICFIEDKLLLVKDEKGFWDLPGGKLDTREKFEDCLTREFKEEVAIEVTPISLEKVQHIRIRNTINVVVVLYSCRTIARPEDLQNGSESFGVGLFSQKDLHSLGLHDPYVKVIERVWENGG